MPAEWLGAAVLDAHGPRAGAVRARGTLLATELWREVAWGNLPALLRYEDRNSMAFGIEARVPFLDHRLVEAGLRLPDRLRIAGPRDRKVALKRAMRGVVPDRIIDRTDKVAFQPPQEQWLRAGRETWRGLARGSRAEAHGFLRAGTLVEAVDAFERRRAPATHLWRVLNLELWLRGPAAG